MILYDTDYKWSFNHQVLYEKNHQHTLFDHFFSKGRFCPGSMAYSLQTLAPAHNKPFLYEGYWADGGGK